MLINEKAIQEPLLPDALEALFAANRLRLTQSVAFPPRESSPPQDSDGPQWCVISPLFKNGDHLPAVGTNSPPAQVKHVDADNFHLVLHVPFFGCDWPDTVKGLTYWPDRKPLEWQITHVLSYDEEMLLRNWGFLFLEDVE